MHHSGAARKAGKGSDGGCRSLGSFLGGGGGAVGDAAVEGFAFTTFSILCQRSSCAMIHP